MEFAGDTGGVSKVSKVARQHRAPETLRPSTSAATAASSSATPSWSAATASACSSPAARRTRSCAPRSPPAAGKPARSRSRPTPDDNNVGLTVDSTILYGGGAGIRAITRNNEVEALAGRAAGSIDVVLRHITAAGSTNGIDLDASNARALLPANQGNITATVSDSLAFNNRVVSYTGVLSCRSSAATPPRSPAFARSSRATPPTLFLNPTKGNFRLLPTATAAIGQGSVTAGESTTDIDGEDRSAAPTDLGADEYNNAAPTAKIVLATATPRTTQPVTFDGRGSSDREGNASIAEYRWRFSDGHGEHDAAVRAAHVRRRGRRRRRPHRRRQGGRREPGGRRDLQAHQRHAAGGRDRQAEVQADVPHLHDDDEDRHEERQEGQDEDPQAHEDPVRGPVEGGHRHHDAAGPADAAEDELDDIEDAVPLL